MERSARRLPYKGGRQRRKSPAALGALLGSAPKSKLVTELNYLLIVPDEPFCKKFPEPCGAKAAQRVVFWIARV
jgi:hypothetical protein